MLGDGDGSADEHDRAVSVAISHALTVAITTILLSGLLVGTGSFVDGQESKVADEQLNEIGHNIVTQVTTLERINDTNSNAAATVELQYPRLIVDNYQYDIELVTGGSNLLNGQQGIIIDVDNLDRRQGFDIDDSTSIISSSTEGPNVRLGLCNSGEIALEPEVNC
jgi:hypothetical protein